MDRFDKWITKTTATSRNKFLIYSSITIFLSIIMMILYRPLCPGQDFFFHHLRLQALMENFGLNPYLIYLDNSTLEGYGYFTKAFYPDFLLIPFAIVGNLTDSVFAYKFILFISTVLCGLFTYIAFNKIFNNSFGAFISSLLYTFSMYRLLDIYHRAALGEVLSFTFIPLIILGIYHILHGDYRKWYILTISYGLMIFSHFISSVLMFIIMGFIFVISYKRFLKEPKRFYYLLLAAGITLLLTAYYIFPMLEQMFSNTFYYEVKSRMSKTEDAGLPLHWIIWGLFTGVIMPKQLFIPGVGFLLTCAIALRIFITGKSVHLKWVDIGVIMGLIFIFAASSLFPWSLFPFNKLNFIQFPWRLFEFCTFFFAIAGGYYISLLIKAPKRKLAACAGLFVIIVCIFANDAEQYRTFRCHRSIDLEPEVNNFYLLGGLEYIPAKVPSIEYIDERKDRIETTGTSSIMNVERKKNFFSIQVSGKEKSKIEFPLLYYKGYKAELNGNKIPVTESRNGLVEIYVNNPGKIEIYYGGTWIQKASYFITLFSLAGLLIFIFVFSGKNKDNSRPIK